MKEEITPRLIAFPKRLVDSALYHSSRWIIPRVSPRIARLAPGRRYVSFSFDDFPRSAARVGAAVIEAQGARATYSVAMGLMTGTASAETAFTRDDLLQLNAQGHELGCHTYSHLDLLTAGTRRIQHDIDRNAAAFTGVLPDKQFAHFAYPYGRLRPSHKAELGRRFHSMRSIFPGLHRDRVDLNLLKGNKLYSAGGHIDRALRLVDQLAEHGGWLILYTHDVSDHPTEHGVTPRDLERLLRASASAGAEILPVGTVVASLLPVP